MEIFQELYCDAHRANHNVKLDDVERIIYALGAALATAETEHEKDRLFVGEDPFRRFPCVLSMLEMANSIEGYAEHVEATVDARRAVCLKGTQTDA